MPNWPPQLEPLQVAWAWTGAEVARKEEAVAVSAATLRIGRIMSISGGVTGSRSPRNAWAHPPSICRPRCTLETSRWPTRPDDHPLSRLSRSTASGRGVDVIPVDAPIAEVVPCLPRSRCESENPEITQSRTGFRPPALKGRPRARAARGRAAPRVSARRSPAHRGAHRSRKLGRLPAGTSSQTWKSRRSDRPTERPPPAP